MIHYHGGPILPESAGFAAWSGRHAFVSFAHPSQIKMAAAVSQSFALDNGAFSIWRKTRGSTPDWSRYYDWVAEWSPSPGFDFAVIPDVIEGTEDENDRLLDEWPFPEWVGAPVWHANESADRLRRLCRDYPRVCIGSCGDVDVSSPANFLARVTPLVATACRADGRPGAKLHGLRMLNPKIFTKLPLASADSTNIAMNVRYDGRWKGTYAPASRELRAHVIASRIEQYQSPERFDALLPPYFGSGE
jgi:hypothetical protein